MSISLIETLQWYDDVGIDEVVSDKPVDQYLVAEQKKKQAQQNKQTAGRTLPFADKVLANDAIKSPTHTVLDTKMLADKAESLDELEKAVREFKGLSICKTATNTVFCDGLRDAKIMLIGEAPGADEDIQGIPFCGASGKLLDQMLACIGLSRKENFYITNTVFWRPPGNRKPTIEELAACKPFVEKHIALMNPEIIILVGGTAINSVLDSKQGITKMRGKYFDYTNSYLDKPIKVTPIFHPSYLLRSPGQKKLMWQDLLMIDDYLRQGND